MSDTVTPGCVSLSGLVSLENRRAVPGKPYTFIYDAIFTCADTTVDGIGSFRTYVGRDKTKKQADTYEVRCKIIAFKPDRNLNSPKYNDADMKLLGEIESMQPLSAVNAPELDDTIRIFGSGTVTSVEPDPPSFLIHATQYIDGGQSSDNIAVRGRLDNNPKWQNPAERIPQPKSIIRWSGILLQMDSYAPPGRSPITCVVVAVKDITYIFTPDKTTAKTLPNKTGMEGDSNLRQQIKSRTRASQPSHSPSSQTVTNPSSSQTRQGKRKAVNSEDEVNDGV
ncbi:hypothetical protein EDB85DRAFT_1889629 [Lactarius pseudohatsudake]|nr:hypothetical protein EDB85DRAFT_1889629 [Lactarius pseudohatsudake]